MKIQLLKNNEGQTIGYEIVSEPEFREQERETIELIRDMYFWGHKGKIIYNGRESFPESDDTMKLKFIASDYDQSAKFREEQMKKHS